MAFKTRGLVERGVAWDEINSVWASPGGEELEAPLHGGCCEEILAPIGTFGHFLRRGIVGCGGSQSYESRTLQSGERLVIERKDFLTGGGGALPQARKSSPHSGTWLWTHVGTFLPETACRLIADRPALPCERSKDARYLTVPSGPGR